MKAEKNIRLIGWIVAEIIAVGTAVSLLTGGFNEGVLLAVATPFILLLPKAAERLFRFRFSPALYLFALFYALGPMVGQCWRLYYLTHWWDKMLHVFGGFMFALFGWFLYQKLTGTGKPIMAAALFALCFSVALSAVWEFAEFGADQLLGMDMQQDTVIHSFSSYVLAPEPGVLATVDHIGQVSIDGVPFPFQGYLDIGLHDSMWDMILESAGAFITAAVCYLTGGKYLGIQAKLQDNRSKDG